MLVLLLLASVAGCGRSKSSAQAYFEAEEQERRQREQVLWQQTESLSPQVVIDMVQNSSAPEGTGKTMDWLTRKLNDTGGQIMFPRWSAVRQGATMYEVDFEYTRMDENNEILKEKVTWVVNALIQQVEAPVWHKDIDREPAARVMEETIERRIEGHEQSLE